jgi:hypothetical protein
MTLTQINSFDPSMADGGADLPTPAVFAPKYALPPASFLTEPDTSFQALTDAGRPIRLYHFGAYIFPDPGEQLIFHPENDGPLFLQMAEHNFLLNTRQDLARLKRVNDPSTAGNCHGWVFSGGKFLVEEADVQTVLADNGYQGVPFPKKGDVAIYFNEGRAAHSGVVRFSTNTGTVIIESKWGPFGVFAHSPVAHPFSGQCCYYRSPRIGHALKIVPLAD